MKFGVEVASQPRKFLKKLRTEDRKRIIKKIRELSTTPLQKKARVVEGRKKKTYRLRVGGFRILYHIFWDEKEVLISIIDKRPRVYK